MNFSFSPGAVDGDGIALSWMERQLRYHDGRFEDKARKANSNLTHFSTYRAKSL
jgi:hypothetical protein